LLKSEVFGEAVSEEAYRAVSRAVSGAVSRAVSGAVSEAVSDAAYNVVGEAVSEAVSDAVGEEVRGAVGEEVRGAVGEEWKSYMGGQFWVGGWWWGGPAYVSFFREVCGLTLDPETARAALAYEQTCRSACWWWPHRQYVIVSERPTDIYRDPLGQFHREGGMAIAWPDGWGVYALHGVRVPAPLVMTPAQELDVHQWVVKEPNAEIRREAVRKIGIERVCEQLGAVVIDRGQDHAGQPCELLLLNIGDDRKRPYIKLRNPSVGVYHIEGVDPSCSTLEAAFQFRNSQKGAPQWIR
jgi:hypothetical protein